MPPRLAIVTTHPIQYYAPVFQALAKQPIQLKVFYTWGQAAGGSYDPDFKRQVQWDLPLLDGYDYELLHNTGRNPGPTHFRGIVNPDAIQKIATFAPDAVLVYGWAWQSHLTIMRHFARRCRLWFRGDSTLLDARSGVKAALRDVFLRWVYNRVHTAFYVGTQNRHYFGRFGLRDDRLVFAPHAVDNHRFAAPQPEAAAAIRREVGALPDDQLLLFAGKLEPKKDPFTLLHAFLQCENENLRLVFVGNGVLEESLKTTAAGSAKADRIHFLPFQNQGAMPAIYQACDVFCLPSIGPGETWGLAVNEAMAAGKAVVVSDRVGCATDLVQPEKNGFIFGAGRADELATHLASVSSNEVSHQMGKASVDIIKDWSFARQVSAFVHQLNHR